jgi:hypothetical protein
MNVLISDATTKHAMFSKQQQMVTLAVNKLTYSLLSK